MSTGLQHGVRFTAPGEDGIARIVIDRPDDSVNALDAALLEDLAEAVRAARSEPSVRGLIVSSAKAGQWVAGADLKMLTAASGARQLEIASRRLQAVLDELAWLPCTTVAAINGSALGGGLELALACDYRVAADSREVSLGQPEVSLGLLPAGGGTQRLPRLIGLSPALDLILSGRRLDARRARHLGLVDEVVHPAVLEQAARSWAGQPKRRLDRPIRPSLSLTGALDVAELAPAGRRLIYARARAAVLKRTRGQYPAPLAALRAVEEGFEHGMAAGLEAESRAFGELATSETAQHLIWLFLATQRHKRLEGGTPRRVEHLGMVGAGFMGAAIAEVAASRGLRVRLRDVTPDAVAHGLARMRRSLSRRRSLKATEVLARVSGTTDYSGFLSADLVIEAVFEDLDVKRSVVAELEAAVRPETVIASNTSALPIRDIAARARRPERIVGMHFFSPAQRMPLLEVVQPQAAADWAVATAVEAGTRMGKAVIVVADAPGFYTTRVLGVMLNEATLLLSEGARITDVDRALVNFGLPVGPFVLFDEVGLDVAQHAQDTLSRAFGMRVPITGVVPKLAAAGQTGRNAGVGFYRWPNDAGRLQQLSRRRRRVENPDVYRHLGAPPPRAFEPHVIQDRLVLLFVNEAIRCLDEGVLRSPTDGDLGAVLGLGFPPFLGGPFHYADSRGLGVVCQTLERLAQAHGPRYAPAQLLIERAQQGDPFHGATA